MNKNYTLAFIYLLERSRSTFTLCLLALFMGLASCQGEEQHNDHSGEHDHNDHSHDEHSDHDDHNHAPSDIGDGHDDHDNHSDLAELDADQVAGLELVFGPLEERNLSAFVRTNGHLKVPPQNKASVTAIIGAIIQTVDVIPGQMVRKGAKLATVSHPDLIRIQTEYSQYANELEYLEAEYNRAEKLLNEEVGSGKEFQRVKSDYLTMKGRVKGLEFQLRQLGLNPNSIANGEISERVSIASPIDGSVNDIRINIGQYVAPETVLFEVIDNHHIHVDLLVYEKDIAKIEKGQKVFFHIESTPKTEFPAEIFAVGTTFEEDPKAVSVHAEILGDKPKVLLPGMYVKGRILLGDESRLSIPEAGVVRSEEGHIIFSAEEATENGKRVYHFEPVPVSVGIAEHGWVEVTPLKPRPKGTLYALNHAYTLLSEMEKGEGGHGHAH